MEGLFFACNKKIPEEVLNYFFKAKNIFIFSDICKYDHFGVGQIFLQSFFKAVLPHSNLRMRIPRCVAF